MGRQEKNLSEYLWYIFAVANQFLILNILEYIDVQMKI